MNEKTTSPETAAPPPFFSAAEKADGTLVIEFLTKSSVPATSAGGVRNDRVNILPGRYEEFRSLSDRIHGRTVVATGRGPVEGYFAIGYYATLFGAAGIVYEGAGAKARIAMPGADAGTKDKQWLRIVRKNGALTAVIEKSPKSDGKWTDDEVGFGSLARLPSSSHPVTFTGSGAVYMYLLLGVSAARANLVDVRVAKPTIPYAVRFTVDRAGEIVAVASEKKGVVVGVVGDPNSGKSVFSRAFYMALRESMPNWFQPWIYDCDLASPTPDWYCSALADASPAEIEEYKVLRSSQKVPWNSVMEQRCADDLDILRTNLDIVIADLPGGRHKDGDGNPLEQPLRITGESRAAMFRQCDAFVVICRKDRREKILKGWLDALAGYGLENRVTAILDSSEPDADFSVSPLVVDENGILRGDIRGLAREHSAGETGRKLVKPIRPLVRALAAIPVINAARASTATAFLTGSKGTRYGAAVRSAYSGRIFAAGQYSSYNHSTNIHAEMSALAQAACAGEPDVDILAITSTSSAEASPCGVCRQVILEHATRTGRDFDVALTTPGERPVFVSVSELLPRAWHAPCGFCANDVRNFPDAESVFSEPELKYIGAEFIDSSVHPGARRRMAIVWDDAFTRDTALFKFKYERTADGLWRKIPHAFTESAEYLRYLVDNRCGSDTFRGLAAIRLPVGKRPDGSRSVLFRNPVPLSDEMYHLLSGDVFAPAGIDASSSVRVTGSHMTGLATDVSDWDLCVTATKEQIDDLRACIVALAEQGRVTFPDKSRSWKLIKDSFPGATADGGRRIHAERRYAESFSLDGVPVSVLFVPPAFGGVEFAFPDTFTPVGRASVTGRVIDASRAPYKRSESVVESSDHRRVRLLCYYKTANLLKEGDIVAAAGIRCLHHDCPVLGCGETLVLSAPFIDRLVWMA